MSSTLADNELIKVKRSLLYKPGDILVYQNSYGKLIAHRLLGYYWKGQWKLLIKADNTTRPDSAVPITQVLGKAININISIPTRLQCASLFILFAYRKLFGQQLQHADS